MMARLTRSLLLLQICAIALVYAATITWWRVERGQLALLCGIAVVAFRLSIIANNFFIAWRYRSETPLLHRITWRQACALFVREFHASMWSSSCGMPFRTFHERDVANPSGLPVLLIHGYGCNSGYWHPLSKVLTRAHITHHAVDLEPVLADIDSYVPAIHRAVEALCAKSGHASIVIVAHSMGGLSARAYLREHGSGRVAQLITLGTPHHGTGIANFGAGENSRQMHWRGNARDGTPSPWLRELDSSEDLAIRRRIVSIYSHHDNIVSPQTSSHLAGARNIEYPGIGHVSLALHPLIQARVVAEIRNASTRSAVICQSLNHTH
jgi:triacylglycerol lipase